MCCHTASVDGQELRLDNGWYEDSWSYLCSTGGSVSVLWQLYRPLLGNTVEISTGELSSLTAGGSQVDGVHGTFSCYLPLLSAITMTLRDVDKGFCRLQTC